MVRAAEALLNGSPLLAAGYAGGAADLTRMRMAGWAQMLVADCHLARPRRARSAR